jgi:hypothetical protein
MWKEINAARLTLTARNVCQGRGKCAAVAHFYPAPLGYVSLGLILTGLQGFRVHTMYLHGQLRYEVELKSQIVW